MPHMYIQHITHNFIITTTDWDPKLGFSLKKNTTNEISNDNNGLCDAALRVGA